MKAICIAILLFGLNNCLHAQEQNPNYVEMSIDDAYAHLQDGDLNILDNKHKITLRSVHFEKGTSVLLSTDMKHLDSISNYLKLIPTVNLALKGYTDNMGPYRGNLDLSRKRAMAVRNYLITKGIPESQLSSEGYGPIEPIANNLTADGRSLNRRVELHFNSDLANKLTGRKNEPSKNPVPGQVPEQKDKGPVNTITLKDGTTIQTEFFMAHTDGKTIGYLERSTKAYKKLKVPDIQSIRLANGEAFNLNKIPPAKDVAIKPSEEAKQEIQKFKENGGMNPTLKNSAKPEQPPVNKPVSPSASLTVQKEDKPKITKENSAKEVVKKTSAERLSNIGAITKKTLLNTRIFAYLGLFPLKTKQVSGSYYQFGAADTLMRIKFGTGKQSLCFGIALGFETEIGKTIPNYFARFTYYYGSGSNAFFHSLCLGGGKILGKNRQYNLGLDIAHTVCENDLGTVTFHRETALEQNTFMGDVSFGMRSSQLTFIPNISVEYNKPGYGCLRRIVRFTFGLPLSIPLRSQINAYGKNLNGVSQTSEIALNKSNTELTINGTKTSRYTLSTLTGWYITVGYLFN